MSNLAEQYNEPNETRSEAQLDAEWIATEQKLSPQKELLYAHHPELAQAQSPLDRLFTSLQTPIAAPIYNSVPEDAYNDYDQWLSIEIAPQAELAETASDRQWDAFTREERLKSKIETSFLHSITDGLTGLFNRRGLDAFIELEQERVDSKLSAGGRVLYMDMSRLKYINDTYGHDAGDAAINFFADTLREILRDTDVISRPGGDEFVVLMRNATKEETQERIESLQKQLKSINFVSGKINATIGARVGVATYDKKISVLDAVNLADQMQNELARQAPASQQRATRPHPNP